MSFPKVSRVRSFLFIVLAPVIGYLMIFLPVSQIITLPDPYRVELPKFKGKIISAKILEIKSLTINKDFESISDWERGGILTYGLYYEKGKNLLMLRAFFPDEKSYTGYQYTQKIFEDPENMGAFQMLGSVKKEGEYLIVMASASPTAYFAILSAVIVLVLLCLTLFD